MSSVPTQAAPAQAEAIELFTFADMRLRPGDRVQLQLPPSLAVERPIVKVIGYLEGGSLIVTAPVVHGQRLPMRENEKIVARVFTSQKAFAFDCFVERVCTHPYPYLHLSYPQKVQGSVIRKSPRVKTMLRAMAIGPAVQDDNGQHQVLITNLSADGALLRAPAPLWGKGQEFTLAFKVQLHHVETTLKLSAIIRSIVQEASKEDGNAAGYSHGLQFINVQPNDSMILQGLIYQQMIEQPHTVI